MEYYQKVFSSLWTLSLSGIPILDVLFKLLYRKGQERVICLHKYAM